MLLYLFRARGTFLTHGSSEGRKVSHCYRSRCCYDEPTCTARVVQYEVVVVAQKPRSQQWSSGNESGHWEVQGIVRIILYCAVFCAGLQDQKNSTEVSALSHLPFPNAYQTQKFLGESSFTSPISRCTKCRPDGFEPGTPWSVGEHSHN